MSLANAVWTVCAVATKMANRAIAKAVVATKTNKPHLNGVYLFKNFLIKKNQSQKQIWHWFFIKSKRYCAWQFV